MPEAVVYECLLNSRPSGQCQFLQLRGSHYHQVMNRHLAYYQGY